ncbi:ATP-binding protein [Paenibacillus doosanensis]|uniref:sensor histidine kinase n=1 Tax=Paenibacillus doosanensis TaxID=1229154 RepID=UPI00217F4761|nr:ATP-binding protein [Paenibacillus doosanensis]MCS7459670.1 ATP-binding protein [Paenibacillus doosanensis]
MNIWSNRRLFGIMLLFTLSILVFISVYVESMPNRQAMPAKKGVLDLTGWDFQSQGRVTLDGEWEFYEGELLEPSSFNGKVRPEAAYLTVPGTWRGQTPEGGMSRKGFGTYRLTVKLDDSVDMLGLKVASVRMSHRLYIDGRLLGSSGVPAAEPAAHRPANTPYSTFFHTENHDLEIIIQAANYDYVTGGIVNSIQLGLPADIAQLDAIQLGADIAVILVLGMFGAYHLGFYFLGRREKTYLLSGLYLLSLLLCQLLFGEKLLQRTFPELPFGFFYKLLEIGEFLSGIFSTMFFCTIDTRLMSPRQMKWMIAPMVVYLAAVILLPYGVMTEVKYVFVLYLGFAGLYMIGRMVYLYGVKRQDSLGRSELALLFGAIFGLICFLVDGILYSENVLKSDIMGKLGIIGFIICMNVLLALRFANAYEKSKTLSRQMTALNERKDEFLTQTSHEIKTPLHGIMNIVSHLLEEEGSPLSSHQRQNLLLVKDISVKLSMLIHDLIDVSRLKHGELRLQPAAVDMKPLVQIVFDVLRFELAGKQVQLDNRVGDDIWVQADENRLRQVMYNLVHNAMKHTSKGRIQVRSRVDGEKIIIFVEDTGTGIRAEKLESIFLEQHDEHRFSDSYSGMGVGLYISRSLIERMQGEIWVDWSEEGRGARIAFSLPAAQQPAGCSDAARAGMLRYGEERVEQPQAVQDALGQQGHTILVVDDEAANVHILFNILRRHHYNVVVAFSAKEALEKVHKHSAVIDLILLDVMMPEISGIELCRMLRKQYSVLDLPIIFATVKDSPQDIALGYRAGANDYITKPFDAQTLTARIQTLISRKISLQEAVRHEQAFHQAQIKPHFLYNALSSVISFCYTDGEKAAHLLTMLSQYLRYILDAGRPTSFVPLHRELELVEAYVEIEKARFGERFDFFIVVEDGVEMHSVPSLCIQPFVENAIRHGLFEKEEHGTVLLQIETVGETMVIIIEDDGVGMTDQPAEPVSETRHRRRGIGIPNIRKRFEGIPGATLQISSEPGRGTKVRMQLPLTDFGELEGAIL